VKIFSLGEAEEHCFPLTIKRPGGSFIEGAISGLFYNFSNSHRTIIMGGAKGE